MKIHGKEDKCGVSKINMNLEKIKKTSQRDKLESGKMADLGGIYKEEPRQGAKQ